MSDLYRCLAGLRGGPTVLLQRGGEDERRWLLFRDPAAVLVAERLGDVLPLLAEAEAAVAAGRWAAGFLSYEAAPALDPALAAFEETAQPLAWWGIFDAPRELTLTVRAPRGTAPADWRPAVSRRRYREAISRIRARIAAGDTYQVNYTFPLETRLEEEPEALFATLCAAQRARCCAFVDTGRHAVCSASPELFFALAGGRILTRPMKGTARRGRYREEDSAKAAALAASEKERAENLMIVDMMRNDLGRIAVPGSVAVDELFAVETYPTVHQLTSTVSARTRASPAEVLRALFPSASITGAPKVSTSRIIRELEVVPRGVYTGSIGFFAPERRARLNVAIRTTVVDRETRAATYGTGGGIVWDSDAASEYQECRAKALVLAPPPPEPALLETLLWRPRKGYFLLERHLERLAASAQYFHFPLASADVRRRLEDEAAGFAPVRQRVRLLARRDGRVEVAASPAPRSGCQVWRVVLDDCPVDDRDPFLFHKTTRRRRYDEALRRHPEADEVVLWNVRGELTESTRANLVLSLGGRWLTPPLRCGLLAGTYRAELLGRGRIHEEVLPVAAFDEADDVLLINSVRGWIRTERATRPVAAGRVGRIRELSL